MGGSVSLPEVLADAPRLAFESRAPLPPYHRCETRGHYCYDRRNLRRNRGVCLAIFVGIPFSSLWDCESILAKAQWPLGRRCRLSRPTLRLGNSAGQDFEGCSALFSDGTPGSQLVGSGGVRTVCGPRPWGLGLAPVKGLYRAPAAEPRRSRAGVPLDKQRSDRGRLLLPVREHWPMRATYDACAF